MKSGEKKLCPTVTYKSSTFWTSQSAETAIAQYNRESTNERSDGILKLYDVSPLNPTNNQNVIGPQSLPSNTAGCVEYSSS